MQATIAQRLSRTQLLVGREAMARLRAVRVILFGVGGVGSWCAEALIRSGVSNLVLVDPDRVCATNLNRQLQATTRTLGRPKVEALRERLLEISPEARVQALRQAYDATTCDQFDLSAYDYVLDAVDTLRNKVLLLRRCLEAGVTVFSSMGAAGKFDVTQVRTAPIGRTRHCPLARMVRKRLHRQGVKAAFLCVYSEELPSENLGTDPGGDEDRDAAESGTEAPPAGPRGVRGSLVPVTGAFGFALAGLVIQDVLRRETAAERAGRRPEAPSSAPVGAAAEPAGDGLPEGVPHQPGAPSGRP